MLALLGGVAILVGLLLLVYLFVNASPASLARLLKWTALGAAALLFVFLLTSERFAFLWLPLTLVFPYLRGYLRSFLAGFRGTAAGGQSSDVATHYLRMSLDHETGAMHGAVLAGEFAGMRLAELSLADLLALLRECRAADAEGARLLEAYLDRLHPDWRDSFAGGRGGAPPPARAGGMSVDEAYEILGVPPGADEAAIRAAHHRLMMQLHPDHGGSDYFASKINQARDLLLKRR
ncbi:MAG: DnaJ domain-containing protein [Alphaproteobacteria bacterium]|nr:DnaJ domain-containing protein [Alphaproteobacteria bacterium]